MFVLADIEWITNAHGVHSPTQLSAIRVDENWSEISSFHSLIRPKDDSFHDWNHDAYSGGNAYRFLQAKKAYYVFDAFNNWLDADDILLWWSQKQKDMFCKIVKKILKRSDMHEMRCINRQVASFCQNKVRSREDAYPLAESMGLDTKYYLRNSAKNDVRVMRELLCHIRYPQQYASTWSKQLPYQYDPDTNQIHTKACEEIGEKNTQGFSGLQEPILKGYKPCACCKADYRTARRSRNRNIIEHSRYRYIFSPTSKVFHKSGCGTMLSARQILGSENFATAVCTGRTACKLCKPTKEDECKKEPLPKPQTVKLRYAEIKQKKKGHSLPRDMDKAVKRQKIAKEERYRKLKDDTLSDAERNDVYTLTQPRFAFWAGRGYQAFHLRSCPKLQGLSDLRGFGTYKDAVRAGYTPCRRCKPTAKHDAMLSIPIYNRVRSDESIQDLEAMCIDAAYPFSHEEACFLLETPVGKWRIHTDTSPISLDHINLAKTPWSKDYHKQPRLFLSLIDVFGYIKRHDDKLEKEKEEGTVYLKFVAES